MQSFLNCLHVGQSKDGITINYSLAQGVGSAVFALSNFFVGRILVRISVDYLPGFYLVAAVLLVGMLLLFRDFRTEGENPKTVTPEQKALLLRKYPYFYLFLAGVLLFTAAMFGSLHKTPYID